MVRETLQRVPRSVSLNTRVGQDQDTQLGDLLEDEMPTPEERLTRERLHDDLEQLLEDLSPREAEVIRLRFGLEDDNPCTLAEIGSSMTLSRERVASDRGQGAAQAASAGAQPAGAGLHGDLRLIPRQIPRRQRQTQPLDP